jgi:hypothetical protein
VPLRKIGHPLSHIVNSNNVSSEYRVKILTLATILFICVALVKLLVVR